MARHRRHLRRRTSGERADASLVSADLSGDEVVPPAQPEASDTSFADEAFPDASLPDAPSPEHDWLASPEEEDEAAYAARRDVSLASMLMQGETAYQRVDGMGLARKALEAPPTGDPRRDLSSEERLLLASTRAWCLLVHGDLGHRGRLDDPFVLADADRYLEIASGIAPGSPQALTSGALLRLRQGMPEEALEAARRSVASFAQLPDHQRSGNTQGAALLAVMVFALAAASSGDVASARALSLAAQAMRTSLETDDAAFAVLMAQLEAALGEA